MIRITFLAISGLLLSIVGQAQQSYLSSQGEYVFSFSGYSGPDGNSDGRMRFSVFPNTEIAYNIDGKGLWGMYSGLTFRNIGLIWNDGQRHKRRALSFGVPLAFKVGDLENDKFLFVGGEAEFFFHYKRKDWTVDGSKIKNGSWLSDEVNQFQPSIMLGYNTGVLMLRAKYYINTFFNEDFERPVAGGGVEKVYANSNSNIIYFSVAFRSRLNDDGGSFDGIDEEIRWSLFDAE